MEEKLNKKFKKGREVQEKDSRRVDPISEKEDPMSSRKNIQNSNKVKKRMLNHITKGGKMEISTTVIKEVIILSAMMNYREMKKDLREDHSKEPISSVEVKEIEHLIVIKEILERNLSIPKEKLMWRRNMLDPLI